VEEEERRSVTADSKDMQSDVTVTVRNGQTLQRTLCWLVEPGTVQKTAILGTQNYRTLLVAQLQQYIH